MISSIKKQENSNFQDTSEKKFFEILSQNPIFSNLTNSQKKIGKEPILEEDDSIGKEIRVLQEKYHNHMNTVKNTSYAILEEEVLNFQEKKSKKEEKNEKINKNNNLENEKNKENHEKKSKNRKKEESDFVNPEKLMELNKELEELLEIQEKKNQRKETVEQEEKKKEQEKIREEKLIEEKLREEKIIEEKLREEKIREEKLREEEIKEEKIRKEMIKVEKMKEEKLKEEKLKEEKLKEKKLKEEKLKEEKIKEEKLKEEKLKEEKLKEERLKEEKISEEKFKEENIRKEKLKEEKIKNEENVVKKKAEEQKKSNKIKNEKLKSDKILEENKAIPEIIKPEESSGERISKKRLIKTIDLENDKIKEESNKINEQIDIIQEEINPPQISEFENTSDSNHDKTIVKKKRTRSNKNPKEPKKDLETTKEKMRKTQSNENPQKNDKNPEKLLKSPKKYDSNNTSENYIDNIFLESDKVSQQNEKVEKIVKNSKKRLVPKKPSKLKIIQAYETKMQVPSKSKNFKEIILEKETYGENNRYPSRIRVPMLCYWKPINGMEVGKTQDGKKFLKIREDDVFMAEWIMNPVKKKRIGHDGKAKKIEEPRGEYENYEIISNDYDSFTALIVLNPEQKKDFGVNKFGAIVNSFFFFFFWENIGKTLF